MYYYGVFGVCFSFPFFCPFPISLLFAQLIRFCLYLLGKCHYDTRHILWRWDIYRSWFLPICLAEFLKPPPPPTSPFMFLPLLLSPFHIIHRSFPLFIYIHVAFLGDFLFSSSGLSRGCSVWFFPFPFLLFPFQPPLPVVIWYTVYIARALTFSLSVFLFLVRYDRYQCISRIFFFLLPLSPSRII